MRMLLAAKLLPAQSIPQQNASLKSLLAIFPMDAKQVPLFGGCTQRLCPHVCLREKVTALGTLVP
jgi:hypothetical protein